MQFIKVPYIKPIEIKDDSEEIVTKIVKIPKIKLLESEEEPNISSTFVKVPYLKEIDIQG